MGGLRAVMVGWVRVDGRDAEGGETGVGEGS